MEGPGAETDMRRWILGYAIPAPHSHNMQFWLVDVRSPNELVLHCDLTRLLPETDPFARQIMMSHGTFLELLDIAARERGLRAEVSLFPEGPFGPSTRDQRPVARIRLMPDPCGTQGPAVRTDPPTPRQSQSVRPARRVPADAWQSMLESVKPNPLRFGFVGTDQLNALRRHQTIAAEAWRIELTTP